MKPFYWIAAATVLVSLCLPRQADAYLDTIKAINNSNKCAMFTLYQRPRGINTQEYSTGERHIILPGQSANFIFYIWKQASYAKMNVDIYQSPDCSGKIWANTYDRYDIDTSTNPQMLSGTLHLLGNGWYRFWFNK
ncbi:MAG: hypothetical protein WBG27_06950 [Candidatus Aquilonibacter sp.]|jgi:hypothetical protein